MKQTDLSLCISENFGYNMRLQKGIMCKDHQRVCKVYMMRFGEPVK